MNAARRGRLCCAVALMLAGGVQAATAPVTDFSGVWMPVGTLGNLRTEDGRRPPLLPEGERLYAERQAAKGPQRRAIDAMARCLPPGLPRIFLQRMPFEIQQEAGALNILFQWNRLVRTVEFVGARNPVPVPGATYDGNAQGRFVGTDLRIDTTGFNDATWLDDSGLPHSAKLHLIERWWLDEGGQRLNVDFQIDDPVYYSGIWKSSLSFRRLPRTTPIEEDVCVERQGMVSAGAGISATPAPARAAPRTAPRAAPGPLPPPPARTTPRVVPRQP